MFQSFIFQQPRCWNRTPTQSLRSLKKACSCMSGVGARPPLWGRPFIFFVLVPDRDAERCSRAPQALGPTARSRLPSGADLAPRGAAGQSGRRRLCLLGPLPIKSQPEHYFYTLGIKKGYFVSVQQHFFSLISIVTVTLSLIGFCMLYLNYVGVFFAYSYETLVFMGLLSPCCHCGLTSAVSLPTNKLLNCDHL